MDAHLVALWEKGFQQFQPSVTFDYQMHGTSLGIPAHSLVLATLQSLAKILSELAAAFEKVNKPVHAYGRGVDDGTSVYFRTKVLKNSFKWNWDSLTEFKDAAKPDGSIDDADGQLTDALAIDPFGIGITNLQHAGSKLKVLEAATSQGGPYYEPTTETEAGGRYPLTRVVKAYINRTLGQAIGPKLTELLLYILSAEGQQDVISDGDYLPLNTGLAREQRDKLVP